MPRALIILVALVLLPRAVWAQGNPLGPEFRVNTYTTGAQSTPSVAGDASGNFVVVWESGDQGVADIFAQRYSAAGVPMGTEIRVNSYTSNLQNHAHVGADPAGNFVVVWESQPGQDGQFSGIFGQRYSATGAPLGPEFPVNTFTPGFQSLPFVAVAGSGNFIVVWRSGGQDGSQDGVFAQRFASSGAPLGPEFLVNTFTFQDQHDASAAFDGAGNFVIVWYSALQDDGLSLGVYAQRYASSGAPLGPEFRVNTYTTGNQLRPSVASDPAGNFVVLWDSQYQDGSSTGVFGQRYASSGASLGPEFRVNTYTASTQLGPSTATDAAGHFVAVWTGNAQDGSYAGVFGQRYDSTGSLLGPEFRVNTYTTSGQGSQSVAADSLGRFVVVWSSAYQDGSGSGIFGQRFGPIFPVTLTDVGVE